MQYIKQRLESISLKFVIGTTVTVGLIAIAVIKIKNFKKHNKPTPRQNSELLSQISIDTVQMETCSEKDFARVINSVKKFIPKAGKLNLQAIRAIYTAQYELSRNHFETIVRRNRIARRDIMPDLPAYKEKVIELQHQIEDLHNRSLDALLAHFKIDKRQWYEIVDQIAQSQSENWELMVLETQQAELDALRDKNKAAVQMGQLVQMCVYKSEVIQELINQMRGMCSDSDRNEVFSLLDRRMSDLLYLKYNVEEEDINYSLSKLTPEEHHILEGLEEKVNDILKQLIQELQAE